MFYQLCHFLFVLATGPDYWSWVTNQSKLVCSWILRAFSGSFWYFTQTYYTVMMDLWSPYSNLVLIFVPLFLFLHIYTVLFPQSVAIDCLPVMKLCLKNVKHNEKKEKNMAKLATKIPGSLTLVKHWFCKFIN